MAVSTFALPTLIDGDLSVLNRLAGIFAPHENSPPSMAVVVDSGHLMVGTSLIEVASQLLSGINAPVSDPRIDRVVVDRISGAASVVIGTEAVSPVAPGIPTGTLPVARVALAPGMSAITNSEITDERVATSAGAEAGALLAVRAFTSNAAYTPTPGTTKVIVEVQGGGGSGGGTAATGSGQFTASSGGSAGSYARAQFTSGFAGVAITVGQGGAAPTAGANNGLNGGASSFGSLVSAPGGFGGNFGPALSVPAIVGAASFSNAPTGANIVGSRGAQSNHGMMLSTSAVVGGTGGSSYFGGGGNGGGGGDGWSAESPGAGGGGSSSLPNVAARSGGVGAAGIVIVYEYA